jgi:hypothetical protein
VPFSEFFLTVLSTKSFSHASFVRQSFDSTAGRVESIGLPHLKSMMSDSQQNETKEASAHWTLPSSVRGERVVSTRKRLEHFDTSFRSERMKGDGFGFPLAPAKTHAAGSCLRRIAAARPTGWWLCPSSLILFTLGCIPAPQLHPPFSCSLMPSSFHPHSGLIGRAAPVRA